MARRSRLVPPFSGNTENVPPSILGKGKFILDFLTPP